ncbi:hypothetical protein [Mycobacterium canetti]|uniref:hypothetical protein n=1 Tax=Mycobacterium canetti TaxID=78331 RepID=UPI0002A5BAC2|nr:hypothetical protein [Mycobacterium canetti]CCK55019.1 Putative transposase [Mycobacterium canettii CIPT 140070008]
MSLDSDLEQLADAAVADWPDIAFSGVFDAAIIDLYRSHLQFPPSWPQERRDEFITSNAEMDVLRLTERIDGVIDAVIDGYVRPHGILPHSEDAEALIGSARRSAIYDLEFCLLAMADEIAKATTQGLGRADASMTGCSRADRRSHAAIRRPTRRRRRRR